MSATTQVGTAFGKSLAGMFGFGAQVETPLEKLQAQISAANSKINTIYQTGLLTGVQDNQALIEKLNALTSANMEVINMHLELEAIISQQNNTANIVHSVILTAMLLIVIVYLIYVPLPKK
jgi:hypothetical protein